MEVYKYTLDKGSKKFLCPNCTVCLQTKLD